MVTPENVNFSVCVCALGCPFARCLAPSTLCCVSSVARIILWAHCFACWIIIFIYVYVNYFGWISFSQAWFHSVPYTHTSSHAHIAQVSIRKINYIETTATHHRFCVPFHSVPLFFSLFFNSLCAHRHCAHSIQSVHCVFWNAIQLLLRTNSRIIKSFPSKLSFCLARNFFIFFSLSTVFCRSLFLLWRMSCRATLRHTTIF